MKINQKYYYMPKECRHTEIVREKDKLNKNLIEYPTNIFFDQATNTGLCIYDRKNRLITTIRIEKKKRTDIVEFRYKFRKIVQELIEEYKINRIFCEDVFGGISFSVTSKLLSIKDLLIDIAYENDIKSYPIVNTKWKSRLSYPNKWDTTEDDKEQIERYVKGYYPLIDFELDVYDAVGMAIAVLFKTGKDIRPVEMRLDKKLKIDTQVLIAEKDESLEKVLERSKFSKLKGYEKNEFDYDTSIGIKKNFRYILTNYDVLAMTEVPYHRYYGQILMKYDIKPSEIGDGRIVGLAIRK